jgi:hypothetical protein
MLNVREVFEIEGLSDCVAWGFEKAIRVSHQSHSLYKLIGQNAAVSLGEPILLAVNLFCIYLNCRNAAHHAAILVLAPYLSQHYVLLTKEAHRHPKVPRMIIQCLRLWMLPS